MTVTALEMWLTAGGSDDLHLAEPVTLSGLSRQSFDFADKGRVLWEGPSDRAAFQLIGCQEVEFANVIIAANKPGLSAFDVTQAPDTQISTGCRFTNIRVEYYGQGTFQYGWRTNSSLAGGRDRNNDCHSWDRCAVNAATLSMFQFAGTQSMLHSLYRCGGICGNVGTRHFIESQNTYTIRVTGGGVSRVTDYVIVMGQSGAGFGEVDGVVAEECSGGLLSVPGNAVTGVVLTIKGCRYNQTGPVAVPTIATGLQVPAVEIVGNSFESDPDATGKWSPCTLAVRCAVQATTNHRPAGSVIVERNCFTTPGTLVPPSIGISSQIPDANRRVFGNQWWAAGKYVDRVRVVTIP